MRLQRVYDLLKLRKERSERLTPADAERSILRIGAAEWTRTITGVTQLAPQASASTNFATAAGSARQLSERWRAGSNKLTEG